MKERGSQAQKRHRYFTRISGIKRKREFSREKANKHTFIYIRLYFTWDIGY